MYILRPSAERLAKALHLEEWRARKQLPAGRGGSIAGRHCPRVRVTILRNHPPAITLLRTVLGIVFQLSGNACVRPGSAPSLAEPGQFH